MPSIVIVTRQCYLLCESINYIAINEINDEEERAVRMFDNVKKKKRPGAKPTKKQLEEWRKQQFQIIIDFVPANGVNPTNNSIGKSSRNGGDTASVAIKVTGRDRCLDLFAHMVEQIREQIPDNKFLDDIVEKFIQEGKDGN